ncbi:MAG TPA: hypothetical protein DD433_01100 [Ruminococcaceae bacterium]|jgi:hypothetical protein|nr:hypothetical protein [Oscillospiraceae bacterium]
MRILIDADGCPAKRTAQGLRGKTGKAAGTDGPPGKRMSRIPGAFDAGRAILSELDKPLDFSNGAWGRDRD